MGGSEKCVSVCLRMWAVSDCNAEFSLVDRFGQKCFVQAVKPKKPGKKNKEINIHQLFNIKEMLNRKDEFILGGHITLQCNIEMTRDPKLEESYKQKRYNLRNTSPTNSHPCYIDIESRISNNKAE